MSMFLSVAISSLDSGECPLTGDRKANIVSLVGYVVEAVKKEQ
jgi:hypothetical protein